MKKELILNNLTCANCAKKIISRIEKDLKYTNIEFDFVSCLLTFETNQTNDNKIIKDIQKIVNYYEDDVIVLKTTEDVLNIQSKKSLIFLLIRIVFSVSLIIINSIFEFKEIITIIIYLISYLSVSYSVLLKGLKNILNKSFLDEFFLMSVASIAAFCIKEYNEAILVIIFYLIGEYLQNRAINSSRKSIDSLLSNSIDYVNVLIDNEVILKNVNEVEINDIILIKKGEMIPLDSVLLEDGIFDTKSITGEGMYQEISKNKEVYSGYINVSSPIKAKVIKKFENSTINKINKLLKNVSANKSKSEKFITKFANYYTPIVIILALLIGIIGSLITKDYYRFIKIAVVFLVISCPCGLVLSIPLSYFAGIAKSSKNGLLVKGGEFFDVISNSKSFVFDKTGTITESNLKIKKIVNLTKMTDDDFIDIILAVEYYSTHPISKSILNSFDRKIKLDLITNLIEHEGMGITCKYNNLDIIIGNNKLLKENKIFVLKNRIVNICINNNYAGYIEFENKLKENVIDVLKYLKSNKKELILLSGDNKNNFEEIKKLNLFDDIKSELLPNQKYEELKEIIKNNHLNKQTTIYLGDGINDSLSLKGSDCGISMGLVGSDLAVESSDIVITDDNMNKLITLINISNKIRKIVLQNVIFILSVKLLVMILSLFGYANIYLGIIADVGVSLIAILNSIRILK